MKRPRPQDARRDLRRLWSAVAVYSCADGTLRIEPTWDKRYRSHGALGPGMFSRMHSAYLVESVLRLPKKRIDWKARADQLPPQEERS